MLESSLSSGSATKSSPKVSLIETATITKPQSLGTSNSLSELDINQIKNLEAKTAKLSKILRKEVGKAVTDFNMIEEGDKIMVCLSGGKDSYALLDILLSLQKYAPVKFEILAVNLDQGQPGFPKHVLPDYLTALGVPFRIITEDTHSIVKEKIPEGKTTCSLCSRLRRGILYRVATEEKCTKIALGHHRDDMVETLFLNLFFAGKLQTMPPKLVSDNGIHTVIRPLAYCREQDLVRYAKLKDFPIIPCNLCGSQPNLQRQAVKQMLQTWQKQYPGRIETIFRSMQNVKLSHLLDDSLYDFVHLSSSNEREFNPHHHSLQTDPSPTTNILASKDRNFTQSSDQSNDQSINLDSQVLVGSQNASIETNLKEQSNHQHSDNYLLKTNKHLSDQHLSDAELDAMADQELFGSYDYDSKAQQMAEDFTQELEREHQIKGLNIKQL